MIVGPEEKNKGGNNSVFWPKAHNEAFPGFEHCKLIYFTEIIYPIVHWTYNLVYFHVHSVVTQNVMSKYAHNSITINMLITDFYSDITCVSNLS